MAPKIPDGPAGPLPAALALRSGAFILLWATLAEGAALVTVGLPAALLAALISLRLVAPGRGRALPLLHFLALVPRLFVDALAGGWDVARRALLPSCPLSPGFIDIPLQRDDGAVAIAVAYAANITPGTLAVEIGPGTLRLHVLDRRRPIRRQVADLERRLGRVFGGTGRG